MNIFYVFNETNRFIHNSKLVDALYDVGDITAYEALPEDEMITELSTMDVDLLVGVGTNASLCSHVGKRLGIPYIACQATTKLAVGGCGLVLESNENDTIPQHVLTRFIDNSELIYGLTD